MCFEHNTHVLLVIVYLGEGKGFRVSEQGSNILLVQMQGAAVQILHRENGD